jgi:hypothetical protein
MYFQFWMDLLYLHLVRTLHGPSIFVVHVLARLVFLFCEIGDLVISFCNFSLECLDIMERLQVLVFVQQHSIRLSKFLMLKDCNPLNS